MTDLITEIWVGLRDAGMPDVMLYLADGSAYRCHWDETALIGEVRVALLADQDRKIVRIMPVHECTRDRHCQPQRDRPGRLSCHVAGEAAASNIEGRRAAISRRITRIPQPTFWPRSTRAARMKTGMHLAQATELDPGVNLCRRDRGVAKHFLDRAEVGAAGQEVGRKAVPQCVRADVGVQAGSRGRGA